MQRHEKDKSIGKLVHGKKSELVYERKQQRDMTTFSYLLRTIANSFKENASFVKTTDNHLLARLLKTRRENEKRD
jgi:regulator of sirC expression with transglutaminase-like and TPR domain